MESNDKLEITDQELANTFSATDLLYQEYLRKELDSILETEEIEEVQPQTKELSRICTDDDRWNYIDETGKIISAVWFDDADDFREGYATVKKYGRWNFIDTTGKIISKDWFAWVGYFVNGYAKVEKHGKLNLIDTTGKVISKDWFDSVENFENGYAKVEKDGRWNFIDTTGKPISDVWFFKTMETGFENGYARVVKYKKWSLIDTTGQSVGDTEFDYVWNFENGYAVVQENGKQNLIDTTGRLVSDTWYDWVSNFKEGYAQVRKDGKENFIDRTGNLIGDDWYDVTREFYNGYAIVSNDGKWNYIDTTGKIISKDCFDLVIPLGDRDHVKVEKDGKWNLVDAKGKPLSDIWFDRIGYEFDGFHEGYVKVEKDGKKNFIDINGNLLSKNWFDDVANFKNGYAGVKKDGKYNFIDTTGKIISKDWFDSKNWFDDFSSFLGGCAGVKKDGKYNFIDTTGKIISKDWFDEVWNFENGYARVKKDGKENFIDTTGRLVSDAWFDDVYNFSSDGYALVGKEGKVNFIDTSGRIISDIWFDFTYGFEKGYAPVRQGGKWNIIDKNGKLLNEIGCSDAMKARTLFLLSKKLGPNFTYETPNPKSRIIPRKVDIGSYKLKKTRLGYRLQLGHEKIHLRYEPIKTFGSRYVLCLDKGQLILYDRWHKEKSYDKLGTLYDVGTRYERLGTIHDIEYTDNILYDKKNNKVYLIYNDRKIDITEYHNQYLKGKRIKNVRKTDITFLTKNQFSLVCMEEIAGYRRARNQKIENIGEIIHDSVDEVTFSINTERRNQEIAGRKEEEKAIGNKIDELFEKLNEYEKKTGHIDRVDIPESDFFEVVGDHKEIKPIYLKNGRLRHINLKPLFFDNVKLEGIDFRGCNIDLDPQKVYGKSLKGCNFEGIYIPPFMNFTKVNIIGAHFSADNDQRTNDGHNVTFSEAIYDETTTYNGIPFTVIYGECKYKPKTI